MTRVAQLGDTRRSSVSPQAPQVQVSIVAPRRPNGGGAGLLAVRLTAGSPHAGQLLPGAFCGVPSNAESRASNASILSGAAVIRFHAGHLSNSVKISERMANVVS